ncbi:MAG: phosphotransferase family protein [Actinomycetota bacterium]|jgi:aminoglycoside phosphotransferase (APT) family kinase protein
MTVTSSVPQPPSPPLVDEGRLADWLEKETGITGPLTAEAVGGGNSNATFLLRGPAGSWILRRPPAAALSGTAHSMAREHRVLAALAGSDVPAPRPVAFCDDADVIGAPFLVMEHVDGVSITDRLPAAYEAEPQAVRRLGEEMIDGLAALHRFDWRAAGLGDFGRPEQFLERQVGRWTKQYESYAVRDLPRFSELGRWLEANRPTEWTPGLMHGDFHLDNCLFSPSRPRLLAIIDWELATIGDPLLDVGLVLGFWGRRPIDPPAMPQVQGVSRSAAGPEREELAVRYAQRSGRPVEDLSWYTALALWKLAAIVEGAYAQFLAGRLRSDYARRLADDVPRLLEEAAVAAGLS